LKLFYTLLVFLFLSANAHAGKQYSYPYENVSFKYDFVTKKVEMSGDVKIKRKTKKMTTQSAAAVVRGLFECDPKSLGHTCSGKLFIDATSTSTPVLVLRAVNGDSKEVFNNVIADIESDGTLVFAEYVDVTGVFVQDRYTFLEKLAGQKDADYSWIKINLPE